MLVNHRLDDYNTSVETYYLKKSKIESDRERVYNAIREKNDGLTCRELADRWFVGLNNISGRFSELNDLGLIICVGKKYLPDNKGMMIPYKVWRVRI